MKPTEHYDTRYFDWQQVVGRFGGTAELLKFQPHILESDNVLDFGCGGGFLLANLRCQGKIGVEVNPAARENCERLNINAFEHLDAVPDGWADKIISNHALEHITNPFETITQFKSKLKPQGEVILVVPCESIETKYVITDINKHLYTWSPINLGNLVSAAGFEVLECAPFLHRWFPKPIVSQKLLGWNLFHKASWVYGYLFRRLSQVKLVATPTVYAPSHIAQDEEHLSGVE